MATTLFEKGNYEKIDEVFIGDVAEVIRPLEEVQQKYNKYDNDTLMNEFHDSIVGKILGFDLVNTGKHGFDCKKVNEDIFLEVKQCSFHNKSWSCTFNDTTVEKAMAFTEGNVFLALGVWSGMTDLICIIYGMNAGIGEFLLEKVHEQTKKSQRRTQSIGVTKLMKEYGFSIIPVNRTEQELTNMLENKFKRADWWKGRIEQIL